VRRTGLLQAQPRLGIAQASVEDATQLHRLFVGADAVVSCLGQRPNLRAFCLGSQFQRRSLPTIIAAINQAQVPRFVLLSSFGAGASAQQAGWFLRTFLYGFIAKKMFDDKAEAEAAALPQCQAHWTALYPVTLKQAAGQAARQTAGRPTPAAELVLLDAVQQVPGIPLLSFQQVADCLLQLAAPQPRPSGQKLLLTRLGCWR